MSTAATQSVSYNHRRYITPSTTCNVHEPSLVLPNNSGGLIYVSQSETIQTFQKANEPFKNVSHPQNTAFKSIPNPRDETMILAQHGYINARVERDTLQGQLLSAKSIKSGCNVAIKRTEKRLHNKRISVQDGVNIVVEENITKEALILRHLTVNNQSSNDYIVRFIEFFESEDAFYLVMEHAGNTNLATFSQKAHALIAQNQMRHKYWKKIVKWLFWQLSLAIHWLHNDIRCCHLDLKLDNIMIVNGTFIENKDDGTFTVDPNIQIKLVDFGLAEMFRQTHPKETNNGEGEDGEGTTNDFACNKHGITDKHYLSAPRVFLEEEYDARKADVWSLGVLLYQLATGVEPYSSVIDTDFRRIKKQKLKQLIVFRDKTKFVTPKMLHLICLLLRFEARERIDSSVILQDEWLCLYYQKYKAQIKRKSKLQLLRNKAMESKMNVFPYYIH
eukprot:431702_1